MPPRDDELPEGTDHIINGAMETGSGAAGDDDASGGAGSGFIGASGSDGTGGTATGAGGTDMTATEGTGGGSIGGGAATAGGVTAGNATGGGADGADGAGGAGGGGGVTEQVRGQIYNLRDQAGGKVREFADTGKNRATDLLEELSRVVADTADSIDERLGNNYGEYARKAADSVSGLADNLRGKEVDELYENVRSAVRKSPGVAIGIAAVVGFTLVRLVKAGLDEDEGSNSGGGRRTTEGRGTGA